MRMTSLNLACGHKCSTYAPAGTTQRVLQGQQNPWGASSETAQGYRVPFLPGAASKLSPTVSAKAHQLQHVKLEMEKISICDLLNTTGTKLHSDRTLFSLI